jgi:iron complex outermembrane receptor protein
MWGSNAVNGVINIITKSATQTQNALLSVAQMGERSGSFRFGGQLGSNSSYRFHTGFRIDKSPSSTLNTSFQGEFYTGKEGQTMTLPLLAAPYSEVITTPTEVSGADLQGIWNHVLSDTSDTSLQLYWDRSDRDDAQLGMTVDVLDLGYKKTPSVGRSPRYRMGTWISAYKLPHKTHRLG